MGISRLRSPCAMLTVGALLVVGASACDGANPAPNQGSLDVGGTVDGGEDVAGDGGPADADGLADGGDAAASCDYKGESTGVCTEGTPQGAGDATSCEAPSSYQKDEDKCDEKDNDCDGVTDETCACNFRKTDKGVCPNGEVDTKSGSCLPPDAFEKKESTCDAKDNDCDGVADEGCNCDYEMTKTGVCKRGTLEEKDGSCAAPDSYEPDESTCDSKDNDCDGEVDEGCTCKAGETGSCYSGPAKTAGVGTCKKGDRTCKQGGTWGPCKNEVTPKPESCNGKDDDCDGITDESCPCDYQGKSKGICSDGSIDNKGRCRPPSDFSSSETSCDKKDNDCDGVTDESCPCAYNGKSSGVCGSAKIDPSTGNCAKPTDYEQDESSCDSKDNDCDGTVDEGCSCTDGSTQNCYTGPSGTAGTGECKSGTRTCTNGSFGPCQNEVTPSSETCNGDDDDCDGAKDEGCPCNYNSKSTGVCAGQTIDNNGNCKEPADYQATESTCDDGLDNDCDGQSDCSDSDCGGESCGSGSGAVCKSGTCTETACEDDADNDLNEGTDCEDSECSCGSGAVCSATDCQEDRCDDGVDNDGDGQTDCDDADCDGDACGTGAGAVCQSNQCVEQRCSDGSDNDKDGSSDCKDNDCNGKPCGPPGNKCCSGSCRPPRVCP